MFLGADMFGLSDITVIVHPHKCPGEGGGEWEGKRWGGRELTL